MYVIQSHASTMKARMHVCRHASKHNMQEGNQHIFASNRQSEYARKAIVDSSFVLYVLRSIYTVSYTHLTLPTNREV